MTQKEKSVYETVKRLMYSNASKFSKKHGNWLVRYCKDKQIVFMDSWNGHIYQANCNKTLENDGHIDGQLRGSVHTIITERECPVIEGVNIYKLLLKSI